MPATAVAKTCSVRGRCRQERVVTTNTQHPTGRGALSASGGWSQRVTVREGMVPEQAAMATSQPAVLCIRVSSSRAVRPSGAT